MSKTIRILCLMQENHRKLPISASLSYS